MAYFRGMSRLRFGLGLFPVKRSMILFVIFLYFGLLLIAFDNLSIAPSKGWAAISPVFFLLASVFSFSFKNRVPKLDIFVFFVLFFLVFYSLFLFLFYVPVFGLFLKSVATLFVGFSFYYSISVYVFESYDVLNVDRLKVLCGLVFVSYFFGLIYGLVYILSYELDVGFLISLFDSLEARSYGSRYSFSFTEPSFVSMHIFGVYLPFLVISGYFFKGTRFHFFAIFVFLLYIAVSLMFLDSVRFFLDLFVVFMIFLFRNHVRFLVLLTVLLAFSVFFMIDYALPFLGDGRLSKIFLALASSENVFYSDGSLASRYFRIDAILEGLARDPIGLIFGYGISNAHYPFLGGYNYALSSYNNSFLAEVYSLLDSPSSNYYNLHLRILSEYGLIFFVFFVFSFLSIAREVGFWFSLVVVYLYFQFDSYAFYTFWIFLFFYRVNISEEG